VKKVYLAYDSDGAGTKAAIRAIDICNNAGITTRVIDMRPYKDPDEFMKNLGRDAFEDRINNAINSFFFRLRVMENDYDMNDPAGKTEFQKNLAAKLCEFDEEAERENYIEAVANTYKMKPEALRSLVIAHASKNGYAKPVVKPKSGIAVKPQKDTASISAQKLLLTWLTDNKELYDRIKKYVSFQDFTEGVYRTIAERVFEDFENSGETNPAAIINIFTDESDQSKAAAIFHATLAGDDDLADKDMDRALKDCIIRLKEEALNHLKENLGSSSGGLSEVVRRKKELEQLKREL